MKPKLICKCRWLPKWRQWALMVLMLFACVNASAKDWKVVEPSLIEGGTSQPSPRGVTTVTAKMVVGQMYPFLGGSLFKTMWLETSNSIRLKVDDSYEVNLAQKFVLDGTSAFDPKLIRLKEKDLNRFAGLSATFYGGSYLNGKVTLKKLEQGDNNTLVMTIEIALQELVEGKAHTISVLGTRSNIYGDTKRFTFAKFGMGSPNSGLPNSYGKVSMTANRVVTHSVTGLVPNVVVRNGVQIPYGFTLVDYKQPTRANSFWDNRGLLSDLRYKWTDSAPGATSLQDTFHVASNYKTTTIYPRLRTWGYPSATMPEQMIGFSKDYGEVIIPGFVRPTNLTAQGEQWSRNVTLKWDKEMFDTKHYNDKGKWVIFRRDVATGNLVNLGTTAYTTTAYVDRYSNQNQIEYGKTYRYYVAFLPTQWNIDSGQLETYEGLQDLWTSTTVSMEPNFKFDIAGVGNSNNIMLNWTYLPTFVDATGSKPYTVKLYRKMNGSSPELRTTFTINNGRTTQGEFKDENLNSADDEYTYYLETDAMERTWKSKEITLSMSGRSKVTKVEASRGNYAGTVKVYWNSEQIGTGLTYFDLYRRPLGSNDDDDWSKVYTTSGTATSYSYDDSNVNPGSYYEYQVRSQTYNNVKQTYVASGTQSCDGFGLATGVISGRVYYDNGTAVDSVRVSVTADNTDVTQHFHALRFNGNGAGVKYGDESSVKKLLDGKSFTMQVFVRPDDSMTESGSRYAIFSVPGAMTLSLGNYEASNGLYTLYLNDASTGLTLKEMKYSHVALSYDRTTAKTTVYVIDDEDKVTSAQMNGNVALTSASTQLQLGYDESSAFTGYLDEFRLFTDKALTRANVLSNYNHTLSGTESNLSIYWSFDEGVTGQTFAYDYSRRNGVQNSRHGSLLSNTSTSSIVPTEQQLGLVALTDTTGNYVIRGIPFDSEGTNYVVRCQKGIHDFAPSTTTRYVSTNSLVYSGVDFNDISSFPVTGTAYYEHTTYPVEGAVLYVDGVACMKDGELVTTGLNGEFSIDVPIGDHYISIAKDGHTFTNNGRYPSDKAALKTFVKGMTGLTFFDNTLVPIVGRVTGGPVESEYELGLGLSHNNIGQAQLTLKASDTYRMNVVEEVDEASYQYVAASEDLVYDIPEGARVANCKSVVGSGTDEKSRIITITTDPETGEFAAMVPPLQYTVTNVKIINNNELSWNENALIDATDPLQLSTDSANVDGVVMEFSYAGSYKKSHRTAPIIKVEQPDAKVEGAFGEFTYTAKGDNKESQEVELYDLEGDFSQYPVEQQGDPDDPFWEPVVYDYTYGYPVFLEGASYDFDFSAYEEYYNADTKETFQVPLEGVTVQIANSLGSGTAVLLNDSESYDAGAVESAQDNTLELDSLGHATYRWTAGLPNIQDPFTRTMSAYFIINNNKLEWEGNGFAGIILGCLPTGNNFVTAGPDKVMMVLRDPPGSASSAYIEEGSTHSYTERTNISTSDEAGVTTVTHLGSTLTMVHGAVTGGPVGILEGLVQTTSATSDLTVGLDLTVETSTANSTTTEVTNQKRISTSSDDNYVGADGDVFIGSSTNYIFGEARQVGIYVDSNGDAVLDRKDVMAMGTQFSTAFQYTQKYIEETLLKNLAMLRDSILISVDADKYDSYVNNTKVPAYITKLKPGDPNYGTNNNDKSVWGDNAVAAEALEGPSYKVVLPKKWNKDKDHCCDTIRWYNSQIENWKNVLYNNERAKLIAIDDRGNSLIANYSFDSGSGISASTKTSTSATDEFDYSFNTVVIGGYGTETSINDNGIDVTITGNVGTKRSDGHSETNESSVEIGYSLEETGTKDALTVDVLAAPDGGSPIFYTRGGQTSCPYEDEVVTKYFSPGQVISTKTMQVEQPEIRAVNKTVSGVPAGKAAVFNIILQNTSETGTDNYFNLSVLDRTNKHGAAVYMDGANLNRGRTILVPADKPLEKTIQVFQTDENVFALDSIALCLSSTCDDNISSVEYIFANYQRACSDIAISTKETSLTTEVEAPIMHVTIQDYDINNNVLESVTLQCRMQGDADWTEVKTWQKSELPNTGRFVHNFDMSNAQTWPDGNYILRAITNCNYGDNEIVNNESNEINFVKDVTRPQLIANASPTDGVLNAGDEISLTFNEDIRYGMIAKADNFYIRGELNDASVAHDVALNLTAGDPAKTESRIDLADRSWAVNMWVKYTEAGHILTHGVTGNQFDMSVDSNNKLVVNIKDNTYISTNALQKDKWMFLSMAYDNENKTITSNYAYDAYDVTLFNAQEVEPYSGNGCLALGEGLTGQIHEVTLWNNARQWVDALSEKSKSKNRYTEGLMGYWRLNEGHGTQATDLSRSRTMVLPSATAWHLENVNYALNLSGSQAVALPIGAAGISSTESYLLELWFRADNTNTKTASIVSLGNESLDIRVNAAGALEMVANGATYNVGSKDYRDNQWHHLAFNALKSTGGNATLYVDGEALKSITANQAPTMAGDMLMLGSHRTTNAGLTTGYNQYLKGAVDEVRIWKQRCTADVIRNNMYNRVEESQPALVAYYPFEATTLDEGMQASTSGSAKDQSNTLINSQKAEATLLTGSGSLAFQNSNVPALKAAPLKQNVSFDFVASDRKVLINLNENPEIIEGCTLTVTVKGVRDQQNNVGENVTWDIYVRQNQLTWSKDEVSQRKEGTDACQFTVDIVNNGGSSENYIISNLPAWLSVSSESGTMLPLSTKTITFTVDPATAAGRYEQAIYLTGSLNIKEPLVVSLNSAVASPEWSVNSDDYEYSMSMIGRLKVDDAYSEDSEDIVAAFNGTKCVGVAKPMYLSRYDSYYVMMTVYGDEVDNGKPLTFKVFDASTGTLYPVVNASLGGAALDTKFQSDGISGSLAEPVIYTPSTVVEQTVALRKGWTWASVYVSPADKTVNSILTPYNASVSYIKNRNNYCELAGTGKWVGSISEIAPGTMYKLVASETTAVSVLGAPVDPTKTPVTINSGWNWIGYNCSGTANLNTAFADLSPAEGDIVKSQTQFSFYTGGEWVGTLTSMSPGKGYCYKSMASTSRTFNYPNVSSSSSLKAPAALRYTFVNDNYESNMTVVAQVMNGDDVVTDAQVAVISDDEMRGHSKQATLYNDDELHFVTVFGKSGDKLHYVVTIDDVDYFIDEPLTFQTDAVKGSPVAPFVLQIGDATGIKNVNGEGNDRFYDLAGRRLGKKFTNHGVYIKNGQKVVK